MLLILGQRIGYLAFKIARIKPRSLYCTYCFFIFFSCTAPNAVYIYGKRLSSIFETDVDITRNVYFL